MSARYFIIFLLTAFCCGQSYTSPAEVKKALEADLKDKIMLLRGFPIDDRLDFDSDLKPIGTQHAGSWTLADFEVTVVESKVDAIELRGNRSGFIFDERKMAFSKIRLPRTIVVELHGPFTDPPETFLKHVKDRVFMGDPKEISSSLPAYWRPYFDEQIDFDAKKKTGRLKKYPARLDKTDKSAAATVTTLPSGEPVYFVGGPVKAPKPLHTPDPAFTDMARKLNLSGKSTLVAIIDSNGRTQDVEVEKPLGLGLDDNAVAIVKTWTFKPAQLNGRPVACLVNIEVSFDWGY